MAGYESLHAAATEVAGLRTSGERLVHETRKVIFFSRARMFVATQRASPLVSEDIVDDR